MTEYATLSTQATRTRANMSSGTFEYVFAAKPSMKDWQSVLDACPPWLAALLQPLAKASFPWLGSFHGLNELYLWAGIACSIACSIA